MFDVIYTEKIKEGQDIIEKGNKVSVSQDYLKMFGSIGHCEVACTGATTDGFCVYVNETPNLSIKKVKRSRRFKIITKKCGNRTDDEQKYIDTLNCVHYLAKAINDAYADGKEYFNVNEWLKENHYA